LSEQLPANEIAKLRIEGGTLDFEAVRELLEIGSEGSVDGEASIDQENYLPR